jgi:hypothetical protein
MMLIGKLECLSLESISDLSNVCLRYNNFSFTLLLSKLDRFSLVINFELAYYRAILWSPTISIVFLGKIQLLSDKLVFVQGSLTEGKAQYS